MGLTTVLYVLAALSLTACAAVVRIGYALHKRRPTPPENR